MMTGIRRIGHRGLTLIELLIGVGIVVALSEVVVPHLAQNTEAVENRNERDAIPTAFENVLSEIFVPTIPDGTGGGAMANNSWASLPTGGKKPLYPRYFNNETSTYFYCWASSGEIMFRRTSAGPCIMDDF